MLKLEDLGFGDELLKNVNEGFGESSDESGSPIKANNNMNNHDPSTGSGGDVTPIEHNGRNSDKADGEGEDEGEVEGEDGGGDRDANGGEDGEDVVNADGEDEVDPDKILRKKVMRKSHMNFQAQKDESCKVCVCSVEGKDEYCSRRPAMNVNECLRMADIMENFQQNAPYDVNNVLAYRIRRKQGGPTSKNQGLCSAGDS